MNNKNNINKFQCLEANILKTSNFKIEMKIKEKQKQK